ncbi:MAG TPA: MBL fold metallo-hydrolase [Solirubrobacterales bacterium]|nr:MBL fold metallo-hydrolase [Solirubrobacterales bacterium]
MTPTPEEAFEQAALAGVHRLGVPTPFAVGKVNAYLIDGDPLTLIDGGPNYASALEVLTESIAAHGHSIEDIGLVLLTHNHSDHLGLAEIVVEHSGAEVGALGAAAERLANYDAEAERDDEFAVELMLRSGVPEEVALALQSVSSTFRAWGAPIQVTRPLADGDVVELADRKLEVLFRPGHSPMDTVFWDPDRQFGFVGDHLLPHISSNPLISRPLDGSPGRTRSLIAYRDSLSKTRELPEGSILFGGHGEPIDDHRDLIDTRFASTERRKEKLFRLLGEGPRSGHELAQSIWGNIAVTQAFQTLSEVIGHMDLLEVEGRVRELDDGAVIRYEAVA